MLISRDGSQAVQALQIEYPLSPAATSFVIHHDLGRRPNTVTVLADRGDGRLKIVQPAILLGPAPAYDVTVATAVPFTGIALLS